jgi:small subunit ribosomal protein S8
VLTDPIADMLTRIRNANRALLDTVEMPTSRLKEDIARLLHEEGYITGYRVLDEQAWRRQHPNVAEKNVPAYNTLVVELKFGKNRERIITDLRRVSKPGRRIYARKDRLPRVLGGMGTAILSTSGGVITSRTAEERGVGGEVICFVW